MKYLANFNVNNGTTLGECICSNNKKALIKEIKDFAAGQIFYNGVGTVSVCTENGKCVYFANALWSKNGNLIWSKYDDDCLKFL